MNKFHFPRRRVLILVIVLMVSGLLCAAYWAAPTVLRSRCVGCGDCALACPTGSITIIRDKAVIDDATCVRCDACVRTCPYKAIQGKARDD